MTFSPSSRISSIRHISPPIAVIRFGVSAAISAGRAAERTSLASQKEENFQAAIGLCP